jgi:hypothetical protein
MNMKIVWELAMRTIAMALLLGAMVAFGSTEKSRLRVIENPKHATTK